MMAFSGVTSQCEERGFPRTDKQRAEQAASERTAVELPRHTRERLVAVSAVKVWLRDRLALAGGSTRATPSASIPLCRRHAVSSLQDAAESVGQSLPERDLAEATRLQRNTITNIETGKYAGDETSLAVIEAVLKRCLKFNSQLS